MTRKKRQGTVPPGWRGTILDFKPSTVAGTVFGLANYLAVPFLPLGTRIM
jgi:hypothetical protein